MLTRMSKYWQLVQYDFQVPPGMNVKCFEEENNPMGTAHFSIKPVISCVGYSQFTFRWRTEYLLEKKVHNANTLCFFTPGRKSFLSTWNCAMAPARHTGWWAGAGENREVSQGASGPALF